MNRTNFPAVGAGLGLRRHFAAEVLREKPPVDFFEVAPENWMRFGGRLGKQFSALSEQFPMVCHGLSLSLGGPAELDEAFLLELRTFLRRHQISCYSEHLAYCGDDGLLYDLMPIPFTADAVNYVVQRIRHVQEVLEQRIAIENISYYAAPGKEMEEVDFLGAVLREADCGLLLDINNLHVNSINHGYDAEAFLAAIPAGHVVYAHVAGHYVEAPDLLVDTHAGPVVDPVWKLLDLAYQRFGVLPTLLERDFNIPPLGELMLEVETIRSIQGHRTRQRRHA